MMNNEIATGYHTKNIDKGVIGEFSKIREEFEELEDAYNQDDNVLMICELTDLIGSIEEFSIKKYNLSIEDLKKFSDKTKNAFKTGKR